MDSQSFRAVMGRFATGVTVITSRFGEQIHGMTVNSLTSVSLVPPTVLFCAALGTRTLHLIEQSGVYAVNILADDQHHLSDRFAGRGGAPEENRFEGVGSQDGITGCPLLDGALAFLECRVVSRVPGGDHMLLLGEAVRSGYQQGSPLLYFTRHYHGLGPVQPG